MSFSLFLYNVGCWLTVLFGWPLILLYLGFTPKSRSGFWFKLGLKVPSLKCLSEKKRSRLWCHAVSVGELNALQSVIAELQVDTDVVVSTTTLTAQTLATHRYANNASVSVVWFPYDIRGAIHRFITVVQPAGLVIAETELWPNVIDLMARVFEKPVMLINGRLSPRSFPRYQKIGGFVRPMLQQLSRIDAQSADDAERFKRLLGALDTGPVVSSGNLKYHLPERVSDLECERLQRLLGLEPQATVITLASTRPDEEAKLLPVLHDINKNLPQAVVVLAPRHPERAEAIQTILEKAGLSCLRRSQFSEVHPLPRHSRRLMLDTIGELVTMYRLSTVVVMGGCFINHGGQNPLEPLSQGAPVIVGPYMQNFKTITQDLLAHRAMTQVESVEALCEQITVYLNNPMETESMLERAQVFMATQSGVLDRVVSGIRAELKLSRETETGL